MSKEMSVILLGVAVVIIPYLGVPSAWRMLLVVLAGIALIVIGFLLRARELAREGKGSPHHPFVENLPAGQAGTASHPAHDHAHEHQERITSLN